MLSGVLAKISAYIIPALKWIKVRLLDPKKGTLSTVSNSNVKIKGDNNTVVVLQVDKNSEYYTKEVLRSIIGKVGADIKEHHGYGISLDDSVGILKSTALTDQQLHSISAFKKSRWPDEIITSLKVAYKIVNLEDDEQFEQAKGLMAGSFNGQYGEIVKKLYNLVRAGYMEEFVMNALMSPISYGEDWIKKTLEYFPEAIFVDEMGTLVDIIDELNKRESRKVSKIGLYARGKRVDVLKKGYSAYLDRRISLMSKGDRLPFYVYIIKKSNEHKIGWSDAIDIVVDLEYVQVSSIDPV